MPKEVYIEQIHLIYKKRYLKYGNAPSLGVMNSLKVVREGEDYLQL